MCFPKTKLQGDMTPNVSHINGRPVLHPNCNRVPLLERRNSLKKLSPQPPSSAALQPLSPPSATKLRPKPSAATPPVSPKIKSPRQPAVKRMGNDPNGLNSSLDKALTPKGTAKSADLLLVKKFKKGGAAASAPSSPETESSCSAYSSSLITEAPGSIAAARREQVAIMQVQRKMRIAHYGRTKSGKLEDGKIGAADSQPPPATSPHQEKRCSFITANSDPIYVAYHDEEWGVPVHDDNMLFELLVLTGAQVGSDWTTVLKKRQDFREAFSGFDAEIVSKYTEKKINSTSTEYGMELSLVRGAVDNSIKIMEMKKQFGSFDKYLWRFVNNKPIATQYKACNKIPVKTSKSESISKDMVKIGFRYVGPTVIHSFMQAAGLTNDHLTTCPRHLNCNSTAPTHSSVV
ncbi:PREDICTED: uncharacterized protein LOC109192650 [Ipomoea nil]|uniref:uncharacterized protein LOC109192650 n=1 Tax=Ipomoea nil TaxID=35883 RepID=UPI000901886B|nr:PREDICTED: uncharacterized protein LOC109192650 [Ipomoea nil]